MRGAGFYQPAHVVTDLQVSERLHMVSRRDDSFCQFRIGRTGWQPPETRLQLDVQRTAGVVLGNLESNLVDAEQTSSSQRHQLTATGAVANE